MNIINEKISLPNGKEISIETGKLAKQADGSVVVRMGDTMILATAVANIDVRDGVDFMPLTVDYREKFASTGKFPGGFLKREARPSDEEILTMRLVDRALRPLFPDDYHAETQVMLQLLSSDKENMPDALACLAASVTIFDLLVIKEALPSALYFVFACTVFARASAILCKSTES
jgi:polyribonucleotide nucleotidyltransferase